MIDTRISVAVSISILDLNPEFDWAIVSVFNSSSSGLDLMSIFESDLSVRMIIVYFSFTYISSFITSSMVPTTSTTASLSSTTTTITASRPPLPKILLNITLVFAQFETINSFGSSTFSSSASLPEWSIAVCGCRSCIPASTDSGVDGGVPDPTDWNGGKSWLRLEADCFMLPLFLHSVRLSFPTLRQNHWENKVLEMTNHS